jgi:hypothetical protein
MFTSYYAFAVLNTKRGSDACIIDVHALDPDRDKKALKEMQQSAVEPARFPQQLKPARSVSIGLGRERAFVPRVGIYATMEKLMTELQALPKREGKPHPLFVPLKEAMELEDSRGYEVALHKPAIQNLGRITEKQMERLLVQRGRDPRAALVKLEARDSFAVPLIYGEARQVLLVVEHEAPCPLALEIHADFGGAHKQLIDKFQVVLVEPKKSEKSELVPTDGPSPM